MKAHHTFCRFIPLLLALALAATASAQTGQAEASNASWVTAGMGLTGEAIISTEMNGELYVLHKAGGTSPAARTSYGISKWDGSRWSLVTLFHASNFESHNYRAARAFKHHNGMLYLGGTFKAINNDPALSALVKWDGERWSSAQENVSMHNVSALEIHNGELYAAVETVAREWEVVRHDGNTWEPVESPAWLAERDGYINTMLSLNGSLYIAGGESSHAGETVEAMRWDGSRWEILSNELNGYISKLGAYNGHIYAAGMFYGHTGEWGPWLARWEGNAWNAGIPRPAEFKDGAEFMVYDDQLYMLSGLRPWSSGPGFGYINRFDGNVWKPLTSPDGRLNMLASYKGTLLVGGLFTSSYGTPLNHIAKLCSDHSCGRIYGTVFNDLNGNCTRESTESGLAVRMIAISPGDQIVITDAKGNYSSHFEAGTYTISLLPREHWNLHCPSSATRTVTVTGGVETEASNLGMQPIADVRDLRVSVISWLARQGRTLHYRITYENVGTVAVNGTIRFFHDPILTYDSARPSAERYSPGVTEWDFKDLKIDESRSITVSTTVPISAAMGMNICSSVETNPAASKDSINTHDSTDTRDSICTPVTGGHDPNDIQVTPLGVEDDGVIAPEDSVLTYWVRFQNTGNDTTFRVVVADTLSSHFDISSIRLGAASHPYSFSIDKSNVLVWTFNNIMLPDSNANERNSHGFFKFSVKLKPNLSYGTRIPNQAHIYFDYNPPVPTNTVVSIIGTTMGVDDPASDAAGLVIYPNPAREAVTIGADMRAGSTVQIRNLLGEMIRMYHYDGSGTMTLDVRDLPAGTYLLTAEAADGHLTQRITVVR